MRQVWDHRRMAGWGPMVEPAYRGSHRLAFPTCQAEISLIDTTQEERQEPDSEFKPNLINTICFLVNFSIQAGAHGCCSGL